MRRFALALVLAGCVSKGPAPHTLGAAAPGVTPVLPTDGTNYNTIVDAGGGQFALKVSGISAATGAAAAGTPAYNPSWYAYTDIYFDPVTGSDANVATGCQSGAVCQTCAAFIQQYGSTSPTMNYGQNITFHQGVNAVPAGTDPCFFYPKISGGGHAAYIGTLSPFYSSDGGGNYLLGTVTQAVTTAGSASDMTIANMPTGTTAGMYIFDSTAGGYAFVESMSGQTGTISQPQNTAAVTTVTTPGLAVGTAWASGDTAILYNIPAASGLKAWRASGGDFSSSAAASVSWVQWVTIPDTSTNATSVYIMANDSVESVLSGVYVASRLHTASFGGRGSGSWVQGSFIKGAVVNFSGAFALVSDYLASTFTTQGSGTTITNLAANTTIAGAFTIVGGGAQVNTGGLHVTGLTTCDNGQIELSSAPMWGAGGLTANAGCTIWAQGGGWAADMLLSAQLALGTATTGTRYNGAGAFVDSIPLTVGGLTDAGSIFNLNSGARFTLGQ
jgi:hypothetical protein